MSIFSFLGGFFTAKLDDQIQYQIQYKYPPQSELSNPRKRDLRMNPHLMIVLTQLARYVHSVSSHEFLKDTGYYSADKRLSDLKKLGYAKYEIRIEGRAQRAYWSISEDGIKLLNSLTK